MNIRRRTRGGIALVAAALAVLVVSATPASAATVRNEIDLQIVKTSSAPLVDVGAAFSYTLAVTNNGPSTAPSVQVTDALPNEVAFVGATTTVGTCGHDGSATGGTLTCDIGQLLPNNPLTITVDVRLVARPPVTNCFTNTGVVADITGVVMVGQDEISWPDIDPSNNTSSVEVCTPPPLGSIGDRVWYDQNADGTQDAGEPGIEGVTATLSGAGAGTSVSAGADGLYPVFGGLAAGAYTVAAACPAGFFATTPGSVDVALAAGQSFLDADFGCSNIDLALTKSVSQSVVDVGARVTFTVTVTNQGLAGATGVTVSDALPAGLTYVSDNGAGSFDPATFVWTIGSLAAGASASLEFVVSVDGAGVFTNVAQVATAVEPDVDSTPGNNVPTEDDQDDATVTAAQVLATCTIGDFVWLDIDGDGRQDSGEPGIANAQVNITNVTGQNAANAVAPGQTDSVRTDANGLYLFADLAAGTYRVNVVTSSVAMNLGLTTVGTYTVTLDGIAPCSFLDADFGFDEVLPRTGMNAADIGLFGAALLLLGALALLATRRMTSARVRSEIRPGQES